MYPFYRHRFTHFVPYLAEQNHMNTHFVHNELLRRFFSGKLLPKELSFGIAHVFPQHTYGAYTSLSYRAGVLAGCTDRGDIVLRKLQPGHEASSHVTALVAGGPGSLGHVSAGTAVSLYHDGSLLVSAARDQTVCLWDVARAEVVARFPTKWPETPGRVLPVAVDLTGPGHPDPFVAVALNDGSTRLLDFRAGAFVQFTVVKRSPATCVRVSPADPGLIVTGHRDGAVMAWDLRANKNTNLSAAPTPAGLSPDRAPNPHAATVIALAKRRGVMPQAPGLRAHTQSVTDAAFTPDGTTLFTAASDGSILRWACPTFPSPVTVHPPRPPTHLAVDPAGVTLVGAGADLWVTDHAGRILADVRGAMGRVGALAIYPGTHGAGVAFSSEQSVYIAKTRWTVDDDEEEDDSQHG